MSKAIYRYSSIARPLEPQYPTNKAMLILLPAIALALIGLHRLGFGAGSMEAIQAGLKGMFAAFLVWALGREVDPDRNSTAFIALGATLIALAGQLEPSLWTLAFALMAARIVNRTVGPAARPVDIAIVVGLAGLAVFYDGYAAMGAIAALAIAIDVMFDRKRSLHLIAALIALSFSVWQLVQAEGDFHALLVAPALALDPVLQGGWLALSLAGAFLVITCPAPQCGCDTTGERLSHGRVKAGLLIVWLIAMSGITRGEDGLTGLLPVWTTIAGTAIARMVSLLRGPKADA